MAQMQRHVYTAITGSGAQKPFASPGGTPFGTYAVQVKGTGAAPTSWTVNLEGSLDGVNWTTIATHNATDGSTIWDTNGKNVMHCRVNVAALTLGPASDITVIVIAVP